MRSPPAAPLVLCVLGDAAVGEALERAVKGRTLAGHSMAVSQVAPDGRPLARVPHPVCLRRDAGQAAKVVAGLRDAPVLTISDVEGFTQLGGIAQFFFEHGQLRFNVQLESAKRARLQISSRLLTLARTTNDRLPSPPSRPRSPSCSRCPSSASAHRGCPI